MAQKLLSASTKIIGVGRNYIAHAKELGNPVPKVRAAPPIRSRNTAVLPTSIAPAPQHAL